MYSEPPEDRSSVTEWIEAVRLGDGQAATKLWSRYESRLTRLARHWLRRLPRTTLDDGEDVASTAFHSLYQSLQRGGCKDLQGRDELWALLATITRRAAWDAGDAAGAAKRGAGVVRESPEVLEGVADQSSPPDLAIAMVDHLRQMLAQMRDPDMEQLVALKLEGYQNDEIARKLGLSRSSIQRMLRCIRDRWRAMAEEW